MPEGPEVKIISEELNNLLQGSVIIDFEILGGRYGHHPDKTFINLNKHLPLTIKKIACKGKFIYWELDRNCYIFNTLGMTGRWSCELEPHTALKLTTDKNCVYFVDIRRFGTFQFYKGQSVLDDKLNSLGPDLLTDNISLFEFQKRMTKNKTLAELLMNQKIFSGCGNYLKSEALYQAKLSPWRLGSSLSKDEHQNLLLALTEIIKNSYKLRGATIKNYASLQGPGSYSQHFQVYKKQKDPLGNLIIQEETLDKRTTHWVKEIQK